MPSSRTTLAVPVALGLAVAFTGPARADVTPPSTDVTSRAEARFHEAERLFDDKQYDAACAAFEESERLDPQLGTLLNLAFCEEKRGKTATAWRQYSIGAAWADQKGQHDRGAWALRRAMEVGRKVPLVLLEVPPASDGYVVELDGGAIPAATWGTPLSVDPGNHVLRVSARGHRSRELTVRVPEGPVTQNVDVPRLERRADADASIASPLDEPVRDEPSTGWSGRTVVGLAGIGLGVAALGVGSYFGVRTFSKKNEASSHCAGSECDATGVLLQDDAHRSATASTVAFAVGGAMLVLGTWLALTGPSSRSSRGGRLQPLVGPGLAGLGLQGAW